MVLEVIQSTVDEPAKLLVAEESRLALVSE